MGGLSQSSACQQSTETLQKHFLASRGIIEAWKSLTQPRYQMAAAQEDDGTLRLHVPVQAVKYHSKVGAKKPSAKYQDNRMDDCPRCVNHNNFVLGCINQITRQSVHTATEGVQPVGYVFNPASLCDKITD